MNKKTLRIAGWALGLSMAVAGIGAAVGATYVNDRPSIMAKAVASNPITITDTDIDAAGSGSSGYTKYNGTHTIGGYSFTSSQVMPSNSTIQFQANAGMLYNTQIFADYIESVTIAGTDALTVTFASAIDGEYVASAKSGNGPYIYTPSGDYKFLKIAKTSKGAANATQITISFKDSSGDPSDERFAVDLAVSSAEGVNTVNIGQTLNLEVAATVDEEDVGELEYSFTSNHEEIASVSNLGVVTGVAAGNATITVSFAGDEVYKPASATFDVTVKENTVNYAKITDLSRADKVVITTVKSATNYYLPAVTTTSSPAAPTCTITNGELTGVSASNLFTVTKNNEGKYSFTNSEGNYLYTTSGNTGVRVSDTEDWWTVTPTANGYKMQEATNSRWLGVYSTDWRSYDSSNAGNYGGSGEAITFYGLEKDLGDLSSIALSGTYPTTFKQGDAFSTEGLVVTATYSKGGEANVTASCTFTGYDMDTAGDQTVTVTYTDNEITKTASYQIKVKESVVLSANDMEIEVGDADVAPTVKIKNTETVVNGCTLTSSNSNVVSIVNNKIHAVGRGNATITASHADTDGIAYTSAQFNVAVSKTDTIADLYGYDSGTNVEFDGYYAGEYADGVVIMDGNMGMILYKVSAQNSWTIDETVLHVSGSTTVYKNLIEIATGSTVTVQDDPTKIAKLSKPTNYTLTGTESSGDLTVANRRTFVTGKLKSCTETSSNYNVTVTVDDEDLNLYLKSADNKNFTWKDETSSSISTYLDNHIGKTVTIKGFTSFFTDFQVRIYGIVEQDDSYTAEEFAQQLLDDTDAVCENYDGKTDNHDNLATIWSNLGGAEKWQALPTDQKEAFQTATANYLNNSENVLENAAGRYNYLCKKYFSTNNFAGRTDVNEAPLNLANVQTRYSVMSSEKNIALILTIALIGFAAVGGVYFLSRRRHEEE